MTRDTCRYPSCVNPPGEQDREDYNAARFCSVKCEVKFEHIRADARDARRAEQGEMGPAPGRRP